MTERTVTTADREHPSRLCVELDVHGHEDESGAWWLHSGSYALFAETDLQESRNERQRSDEQG
jgi:hypothetical protein